MMKTNEDFDISRMRWDIEVKQDWRGELDRIPFINFPAEWAVQVIPPFSDACVRFRVKLPSGKTKSVYLDVRESLGFNDGEPYWEVYPYQGDVGRCGMDDTKSLLEMIADETEE